MIILAVMLSSIVLYMLLPNDNWYEDKKRARHYYMKEELKRKQK